MVRGSAKEGYQFLFLLETEDSFQLVWIIYPSQKFGESGMEDVDAQQVGLCGCVIGREIHVPIVPKTSRLIVVFREYEQFRGKISTGSWMVGYPVPNEGVIDFGDSLNAVPLEDLADMSAFLSKQPYWKND